MRQETAVISVLHGEAHVSLGSDWFISYFHYIVKISTACTLP